MRDSVERNYGFVADRAAGEPFAPLADAITFQEEPGSRFIPDLKDLLPAHWREAGRHHDRVPMAVDWEGYLRAEAQGNTLVVTVRDDHRLVGYTVFVLSNHPNYKTSRFANVMVYYVRPDYRRRGFLRRMIEIAEPNLWARGCVRIYPRSKTAEIDAMLEDMGYTAVERTFEKVRPDDRGNHGGGADAA